MFRYKQSIPVSRNAQGYIYFKSRLYNRLPVQDRQQIVDLCLDYGGEYYQALFQFVTTDSGADAICIQHNVSRSSLERVVSRYYVGFSDKL